MSPVSAFKFVLRYNTHSSMFKRYTWPAKRAIFYARCLTILAEAKRISSVDLLRGLLWGDDSRAQSMFELRERFPLYKGCPWKIAEFPKEVGKNEPALDGDCRLILAWAAAEANRMGDYWIDTEHLLLGILRVRSCTAAWYLERAGFNLRATREVIRDNSNLRPDYGTVPFFWPMWRVLILLRTWGWP